MMKLNVELRKQEQCLNIKNKKNKNFKGLTFKTRISVF